MEPEGPRTGSLGWGLGEVALALVLAQVGGLIVGSAMLAITGESQLDDQPLWALGITNIPLWVAMGGMPWFVCRRMGRSLFEVFGLVWQRSLVIRGFLIGLAVNLFVLPLVYLPVLWLLDRDTDELSEDARELTDRAQGVGEVLILVIMVLVLAPVLEELFYRGMLQRAVQARLGDRVGIVVTAAVFALVHFQPLPMIGLFLLGLVLGFQAHSSGGLSVAIAGHLGFNLVTLVSLLA